MSVKDSSLLLADDEHFEVMSLRLRSYSGVRAVRDLRERARLVGAQKG